MTKPKNVYSFTEAARMIHLSYRVLYKYANKKQLNYVTYKAGNTICKGLELDEINRLKKRLTITKDLQNVQKFSKAMRIPLKRVAVLINELQLKPVLKYERDRISVQSNYYYVKDLIKVNQLIYDQKSKLDFINPKKVQKAKFEINTTTLFDYHQHYSVKKLIEVLSSPQLLSTTTIYQWIVYGRINEYQIDLHGKIYFTKEQAKAIKDKYMCIPDDAYINNRDLANKIGIDPSRLVDFRKYYNIPVYRVLGSHQIYYTKTNADKLMDWYRNAKHRPTPYKKELLHQHN